MKIVVLYVIDGTPDYKVFKNLKLADEFVELITSKNIYTENNYCFLTGIVVGNYVKANLDYKKKEIIKKFKSINQMAPRIISKK